MKFAVTTKGLYDHCQSDDLEIIKVTSAAQIWLMFNLQYLGQYLSYYIQTWHDCRLMDAMYAHSRSDDLNGRWRWVGKGKISVLQLSKQ